MKGLYRKQTASLLVKTVPIVLILVQFSFFVSVHKDEDHRSVAYHSHRQDVIVSQHSPVSRFVLNPLNTFHLLGIGTLPYNFNLQNLKGLFLPHFLQAFHRGGAELIRTTINAP